MCLSGCCLCYIPVLLDHVISLFGLGESPTVTCVLFHVFSLFLGVGRPISV